MKSPVITLVFAVVISFSSLSQTSNEITIPEFGTFDLSEMKTDSIHKYVDGDCRGNIKQFSSDLFILGIDSMNCEMNGFRYTNFLFNADHKLIIVHQKKTDCFIVPEKDILSFIFSENIYCFDVYPSILYQRVDTVNSLENYEISTDFNHSELKNAERIIELLKNNYQKIWSNAYDNL